MGGKIIRGTFEITVGGKSTGREFLCAVIPEEVGIDEFDSLDVLGKLIQEKYGDLAYAVSASTMDVIDPQGKITPIREMEEIDLLDEILKGLATRTISLAALENVRNYLTKAELQKIAEAAAGQREIIIWAHAKLACEDIQDRLS